MENIKIQTVLIKPEHKQSYYMKNYDTNKVSRISRDKWFRLYDQGAEVLPPITKE